MNSTKKSAIEKDLKKDPLKVGYSATNLKEPPQTQLHDLSIQPNVKKKKEMEKANSLGNSLISFANNLDLEIDTVLQEIKIVVDSFQECVEYDGTEMEFIKMKNGNKIISRGTPEIMRRVDSEDEFSASSFSKYRAVKEEEMKKNQAKSTTQSLEDEDEETKFIKSETAKVKNESLESTRNSLKTIQQAEELGRNTMIRMRDQSDQLARVEEDMAVADEHLESSYKSAKDLKKYSGLFPFSFGNMFGGKMKKKGDKKFNQGKDKLVKEELTDLKKKAKEERKQEKQERKQEKNELLSEKENVVPKQQHEDEIEQEIGDNLDLVVDSVRKLKIMSLTMLDEMEFQDRQIDRITLAGDHVEHMIKTTTAKLRQVV